MFHECDLLVAECLLPGVLDDLGPAELAGLVSMFVLRAPQPRAAAAAVVPVRGRCARRWQRIAATSDELAGRGAGAGLAVHRPPDPTFVAVAYAWAAGEGFAEVVDEEELTGGDFVRTTKQLIDLLRQLALVAPDAATRETARAAAERSFRGVVADAALVTTP